MPPTGSLLYAVTTIEDVTQLKRSEFTQQLLARAGELFGASTDYHQTVQAVSRVVVPQLADWCSVNIPDETGTPQQAALAHRDRRWSAWARSMERPLPLAHGRAPGAADGKRRRCGSTVAVPMTAGAKIVGVLVFGNDPGSRSFDQSRPGDRRGDCSPSGHRGGERPSGRRASRRRASPATRLAAGAAPGDARVRGGNHVPAGWRGQRSGRRLLRGVRDRRWMDAGDRGRDGSRGGGGIRDGSGSLHDPHRGKADRRSPLSRTDARRKPQAGHGPLAVQRDHHGPPRQRRRSRASVAARRRASPAAARSRRNGGTGRTPGPLPGAPHRPSWDVTGLELSRGDQLVLYTDGVTEARGERDRFGEDRLREACPR